VAPKRVRKAEDDYRSSHQDSRSIPDHVYRNIRTRPLLLIHCLEPYRKMENQIISVAPAAEQFIALGLSFPRFDDSQSAKRITYKVNLVEWRALFEEEAEDDGEEE
jgi:hypothetical protein